MKDRKGERKGENEQNENKFDLSIAKERLLKVGLHNAGFRKLGSMGLFFFFCLLIY